MSTKRTDVIIRTQINILSVFDNIYIFLSRVNQGWVGGGRGLPNACACVRARYRWPWLMTRSNGTSENQSPTGDSIQNWSKRKGVLPKITPAARCLGVNDPDECAASDPVCVWEYLLPWPRSAAQQRPDSSPRHLLWPGAKVKALESAAAQQSCHLSPGAEAPAIDEGILEISYLGMVHLHLQRKERILLAAGVQCLVSSSTPLRFIENSFSVQAQSLTSTVRKLYRK